MKKTIQFNDTIAHSYRKKLKVLAFRTNDPIVFHKSWGEQQLRSKGWVIVSLSENGEANGDIYGCDASVFDETYEQACPTNPNIYRKSELIRAYQPGYPFQVDTILGDGHLEVDGTHSDSANAWFVKAPNGELYIIEDAEFQRIYVLAG